MSLEEKVMYLYEDILEPEDERKIVLLLKYVIIDKETNLKTIKQELRITDDFIQANINNDSVMLKYLTENELKKFRLRMDVILGNNLKLIKLINLVLTKNETNLDVIIKSIPISVATLKVYVNDNQKLLKYLTNEELEKFLNKAKSILYKTNTKLERLIEVVLVEGETNLDNIEKKAFVKILTIKKHIENPKQLEKYLTKEQIDLFVSKVTKMFKDREKVEYEKDKKYIGLIINDILATRYLYADICAKHLFSVKKFEKYIYDEEYMKKEFPKITVEMLKDKIKENEKIRMKRPYNMFIIEDKFFLMITKKEIHYLDSADNKKITVVSHYLGTGANLQSVMEYFKISDYEALIILSDKKLQQILDLKYYDILNRCLSIEKVLLGNDLTTKKQFILDVTNFLEINNYDMQLAMLYFKIPEPLFSRVLKEITKLPYASSETKNILDSILNSKEDNKTK